MMATAIIRRVTPTPTTRMMGTKDTTTNTTPDTKRSMLVTQTLLTSSMAMAVMATTMKRESASVLRPCGEAVANDCDAVATTMPTPTTRTSRKADTTPAAMKASTRTNTTMTNITTKVATPQASSHTTAKVVLPRASAAAIPKKIPRLSVISP